MTRLASVFDPDRVAVVGATERPGSVGRALMENLSSFDGELLAVNPNRESVFDRPAYPTVSDLPDAASVDLAVVVVPVSAAVEVVREIGAVGIGAVVVITAGFGEVGPDGQRREQELQAVADRYDLDLVGPNSVGVIGTRSGLNATFLQTQPTEGSISLMSQSGAFISAVLGWATQHGIGFGDVVSLGNEAVLDENDFVAEWGADSETDVILAYLEDIDDGRRFVETARRVTPETPVVVIKSGRTAAGARAAASHTGSIAGSDEAYQAGFHEAGVIRATTLQEAFDVSRMLAGEPRLASDEIGVVTNGGGPGVLTTDALGDSGLSVASFGDELQADLDARLPDRIAVANPLDLVGDADVDRFRTALDATLASDDVGGVIVLAVPTAVLEFDALAAAITACQRTHQKPVVACLMGGPEADRAAERLAEGGIPNYFDPARAVGSLDALATHRAVTERTTESPAAFDVDRSRARSILTQTLDREVDHLSVEAMGLLDAYGIPTPPGGLATSPAEAAAIAARLDGPVAMKLASPDILHKSEIGVVAVGVSESAVRGTYEQFLERARAHDPDAAVLGVQIEETVRFDEQTEVIVGVNRDAQFGHLVLFGLGGIFVEVFEDTAIRMAPVGESEARAMTEEIQAAPMLRGARGRTPADLAAVVETIQRVSQLVTDFPAITELDINPLLVSPEGVSAVDLRLGVDRSVLRREASRRED